MSNVQLAKIFISIAAYRDPELKRTLESCIKSARHPERLRFCIAWQHASEDEWDELGGYIDDRRFTIIDIDCVQSRGVCWARKIVQEHYSGEGLYLQLDSHHRFAPDWDVTLEDWLNFLVSVGISKPLITAYLPAYSPEARGGEGDSEVFRLRVDRFLPNGVPFLAPAVVSNWRALQVPFRTSLVSAHFIFTQGRFVDEVPYDECMYFHGEETSLALRAFTHGYTFFSPHRPICWHEYTRLEKRKHWDDHSRWHELESASVLRFHDLTRGDSGCTEVNSDEPGLGNVRTIAEFEEELGVCFETSKIVKDTSLYLLHKEYVREDRETRDFEYTVSFPREAIADRGCDFLVVAFLNAEGMDVYRQDCKDAELNGLLLESMERGVCFIRRSFRAESMPRKWRVWPHSETMGWLERIEGVIQ